MTRTQRIGFSAAALTVLGAVIWYSLQTETAAPARIIAPASLPAQTSVQSSQVAAETSATTLGPEPPDGRAYVEWIRAVRSELIRRGDAESLVVAAYLTLSNMLERLVVDAESTSEQVKLLQKASSLAPSSSAVQWLAWTACIQIVERKLPCDADSFARALRAADPKSAFPLIDTIERAQKAKDPRAEADAVAAVEAAGGFNNYSALVQPILFNTVDSVRIPPPQEQSRGYSAAQLVSLGLSAWLRVPSVHPLVSACDRNANDPLASRCLSIAQQLRTSDNYLVRRIGLQIAERVTLFGSVQAGEISEERRALDWLAKQIGTLPPPPEAQLRLLAAAGGEVEMWRAWLKENDLPITPPVDWEKN